MCDHRRAERSGDARDLLSDMAAADDADGGRRNLAAASMPPFAAGEFARERNDASTEGDHETDRQLRDGLPVDTWRPSNRDAVTARRAEIDHVEPDAVLADDAEVRQRAEYVGVEHVEARDRMAVSAEEVHEGVAGQNRRSNVVE